MRALDWKLIRDLGRMWAQALTIAVVLACGIASFVAMRGAYTTLLSERDSYYAARRFGDVFATLERAPESIAPRLEAIPGVARVYPRIVKNVLVPIEGAVMPAVGAVVSLPAHGESPLSAPQLLAGRMPEPDRDDEVLLLASFAEAWERGPGGTIDAVIGGRKRTLQVVGLAQSPEYVFVLAPGGIVNDPKRFAVLWMNHDAAAAAFQMSGSFNDLVVSLAPGASEVAVIDDVRALLRPYGVTAVFGRDRQLSNHMLSGELQQLSSYAIIAPAIFLGVAAFLINVVLVRTLSLQRSQIATLKAIGYTNREIAWHYLRLVFVILAGGIALGLGVGDLLGRGMISLYRPAFRFPVLAFRLDWATVAISVLISAVVGVTGAMTAIRRAVRIPPAEAMQPEAPPIYRRRWVEATGLARLVSSSGRMVFRELVRRPLRTALSALAIALATATVMSGRFGDDAVHALFDTVFDRAERYDIEVSFEHALPAAVTREIAALPGVVTAEGSRTVAVRARSAQRYRDVPLVARNVDGVSLRRVPTWPFRPTKPPLAGVSLSRTLADALAVKVGDPIELEVLEGDRRTIAVTVAGLVDDLFGLQISATDETIAHLLGEDRRVTSVLLTVDPVAEDELLHRLADIPSVRGINRRKDSLDEFYDQTRSMWVTMAILTLMGAAIAFGVVYNQARIALSTRSRDLASLRVLGFTRREISAVLLGELAVYVALGIPVGWPIGRVLVSLITSTVDPETYRMPPYVSAATYAFATLVTLGAAAVSALVVRRRLDALDLVSVLKARE